MVPSGKATTQMMASIMALCLMLFFPLLAPAEIREIGSDVYSDSFAGGQLGPLVSCGDAACQPKTMKIVEDEGKKALLLSGNFHSRIFFTEKKFRNCAVESRIRKESGSYAGVVVRDKWLVYFQMSGALCLSESNGKLLFQSDLRFQGYHFLKVVCVGPILRAYVDGALIFTQKIEDLEGRVGFYTHHSNVYYQYFRVSTRIDPLMGVHVEPEAPDDSLVVAPEEKAKLSVSVSNFSDADQDVTVAAAVKTWDNAVVSKESRQDVNVGTGKSVVVEFNLGRIPTGFYKVELYAKSIGKEIDKYDDLPLAVQQRGSSKVAFPPVIPVAPYSRYGGKLTPIYQNTYAHATARSLKDHHFNAIVADLTFNDKVIDIFQSYGISVITRGSASIQHSNVIGSLQSDEPQMQNMKKLKQQYTDLRKRTDKPLVTCMVGDDLGLDDTIEKWRLLAPDIRAFRWYGIKKSFYGIQHQQVYKGRLSFSDVLTIAENCAETPYWVILPSFGGTDHEAYYHNPSAAEMKGMMHLSLAHGASGLLFYTLETEKNLSAFLDRKTLKPCDGKYKAATEVAALVQSHAKLLKGLKPGDLDVRCPDPVVDAVPRTDSREGGHHYLYVVNKDTLNPIKTRIMMWARGWEWTTARDIFSGKNLPVTGPDEEGYMSAPIELEPGDGMLIETDAHSRPR